MVVDGKWVKNSNQEFCGLLNMESIATYWVIVGKISNHRNFDKTIWLDGHGHFWDTPKGRVY